MRECAALARRVYVTDLRHVEGGGHLLQLGLHRAVAEGSLQHRLLDAQQLAHLLQICRRGSRVSEETVEAGKLTG